MLLKCGFFFPEELRSPVARGPIHLTLSVLFFFFNPLCFLSVFSLFSAREVGAGLVWMLQAVGSRPLGFPRDWAEDQRLQVSFLTPPA